MPNNYFLTGAPSSGKTTAITKIIKGLNHPANGFYTVEERIDGKRAGFMMHSLDGQSGYLAHQDITSDYSIRRYGVSMENIESIAVKSIIPVENHIIVLDEIGKMECFSSVFRKAALEALDSKNTVVGTITLGGDEFIRSLKERKDIEIFELNEDNRNNLPDLILQKISILPF